MRISNAQITATMHGSLNISSEKLGKLMQQMATGKRMLRPSDDPRDVISPVMSASRLANPGSASDSSPSARSLNP